MRGRAPPRTGTVVGPAGAGHPGRMPDTELVDVVVVPLGAEHADAVVVIYRAGVDEGDATFETSAPTWEEFDAAKLPAHRFAAPAAPARDLRDLRHLRRLLDPAEPGSGGRRPCEEGAAARDPWLSGRVLTGSQGPVPA